MFGKAREINIAAIANQSRSHVSEENGIPESGRRIPGDGWKEFAEEESRFSDYFGDLCTGDCGGPIREHLDGEQPDWRIAGRSAPDLG